MSGGQTEAYCNKCGLITRLSFISRKKLLIIHYINSWPKYGLFDLLWKNVQVNLFQKPSFLHQLTHNMTRDCSLNSKKKYKFTTCCVQKLFFCFCFDIQNNICTQHLVNLYFSGVSMNNLSSYCGLSDSKMRVSDTDLPVTKE